MRSIAVPAEEVGKHVDDLIDVETRIPVQSNVTAQMCPGCRAARLVPVPQHGNHSLRPAAAARHAYRVVTEPSNRLANPVVKRCPILISLRAHAGGMPLPYLE